MHAMTKYHHGIIDTSMWVRWQTLSKTLLLVSRSRYFFIFSFKFIWWM